MLGNSNLLQWAGSLPDLCPEEDLFVRLDSQQTCLLLQRETLLLSSKAVCLKQTLKKMVWNKDGLSAHKTCRNLRDPWRTVSSHGDVMVRVVFVCRFFTVVKYT